MIVYESSCTLGIQVIGATITPCRIPDYYHPNAENDSDRQTINEWIRDPKHFDAVMDFDKVVRDPANPDHLNPAFDSGDHLHPSAGRISRLWVRRFPGAVSLSAQ